MIYCDWKLYFQDEASTMMGGIIDLHDTLMYYLIFIVTFVFYFLIIKSKTYLKYWNHSTSIEIIWTIIPAIILIIIAIPSFKLLYNLDSDLTPELTVKAIGNQWFWNYQIGDFTGLDIAFDSYLKADEELLEGELRLFEVDNRLVLPINTPIRFIVTGNDVIHSFALPVLGIKIDAIPGRLNTITTEILRSGIFFGQCSEACRNKSLSWCRS